jgi:RNA polymerase sigma-70 factor, ECF subfamily
VPKQSRCVIQPDRHAAKPLAMTVNSHSDKMPGDFDHAFEQLLATEFPRLFRYLDRLSGEPDLAADLAQEAFVRLFRRGSMPDQPASWLVTVALNLFRNVKASQSRRLRLLAGRRFEVAVSDPSRPPDQIEESGDRDRVRAALGTLPQRERELLVLRAEGYSYHQLAAALGLHEPSIGTLLARAKRAFREAYERGSVRT